MPHLNAVPNVTDTRSFCITDEQPLFSVNPGIPVEDALEQASHLLACLETLTQQQGALDDSTERVLLQTLAEMTHALVDACQPQDPAMLQQGLRMAAKARAEAVARVSPIERPAEG